MVFEMRPCKVPVLSQVCTEMLTPSDRELQATQTFEDLIFFFKPENAVVEFR